MRRARKPADSVNFFEEALQKPSTEIYVLKLYIAGNTLRSLLAVANIRHICEESLQGRYDLQVIDIYRHPQFAKPEQIVVAPTLIRKQPKPERRIIGDLSNRKRVLSGLNLPEGPIAG
jgi:circadian clock protein KaiB